MLSIHPGLALEKRGLFWTRDRWGQLQLLLATTTLLVNYRTTLQYPACCQDLLGSPEQQEIATEMLIETELLAEEL